MADHNPAPDVLQGQHPEQERLLRVVDAGVMRYAEALELQREVAKARITGTLPQDILLLVEHPPVVTLGRSAKAKNLMASPEFLLSRGVELFEVERGGDVTFHGPGQLVGYPVLNLRRHKQDLHWYLRQIEAALAAALAQFGIVAGSREGLTGVWVDDWKIASIGVHARDWVTWHGFALNVTTDLSYFDFIVPCGITGVTMTSIEQLLAPATVDSRMVRSAVASEFAATFNLQPVALSLDELRTTVAGESVMNHGR